MSKALLFLKALNRRKENNQKKSKNIILILMGIFIFVVLVVIIIFIFIFLPFAGASFFSNSSTSFDSTKNNYLDYDDPMDNKGFVEDVKKSIKYGENWADILATLQSKRMIFGDESIKVEDAATAVNSKNAQDWIRTAPKSSKSEVLNNMGNEEIQRTLDLNKGIIKSNIASYIGYNVSQDMYTLPLNGSNVQNWKYDSSLGYLSFDLVDKAGNKTRYETYNVSDAKFYPDLKSAEDDLKDEELAKKYAGNVVFIKSSEEKKYGLQIIVNFPLDKNIKVEDENIVSALGVLAKADKNIDKKPQLPLNESPQEAGLSTYIKLKQSSSVLVPEDVKVYKTYYDDNKKSYTVILQSLDNQRRYKFENLSRLAEDCTEGKIYVSRTGGSVPFAYIGENKNSEPILKMSTYLNFERIFKEDIEENLSSANAESRIIEGQDLAVSDGFYEVDSYKTVLLMKEARVNEGGQTKILVKYLVPDK